VPWLLGHSTGQSLSRAPLCVENAQNVRHMTAYRKFSRLTDKESSSASGFRRNFDLSLFANIAIVVVMASLCCCTLLSLVSGSSVFPTTRVAPADAWGFAFAKASTRLALRLMS